MTKYKYIHIFYADELKFNLKIVEMINDKKNGFMPEEHLFVTPHQKVYEKIERYKNTRYEETYEKKDPAIINKYGELGSWLIVHSMPSIQDSLFIKDKYCKKIIWRSWGNDDVVYTYKKGQPIKVFIKHIIEYCWKCKVRKFHAVGIANTVDIIEIKRAFGDVECYRLPYPGVAIDNLLEQYKNIYYKKQNDACNVLLGHSGSLYDNHIKILEKLEPYKDEKIHIYIILSYGNGEYIESVVDYVEQYWKNKVTIITEFMEYEAFIDFLSMIDVAILDGERSYALGNIAWLLFMHKKLFINRNGVIREALDLEAAPYECTDEIGVIPFENFRKSFNFEGMGVDLLPWRYEEYVQVWHYLLDELEHSNLR